MARPMAEQSSSAGEYRFFLDLFIVHPTLVPDQITRSLTMEPDVTHCVGAPRRTAKGTPLSGTYATTRWRRSTEYVVEDPGFASELSCLIGALVPHKAFFSELKANGGTASIINQFMDGFLADELSSVMLARLLELDLSLGIECYAGLPKSRTAQRVMEKTTYVRFGSKAAVRTGGGDFCSTPDSRPAAAQRQPTQWARCGSPCHYSISSSALASNDGGTVRPSAFAVRRFMLITYCAGCSTGISAGRSPLMILSTNRAL